VPSGGGTAAPVSAALTGPNGAMYKAMTPDKTKNPRAQKRAGAAQ